jgi:hypothetical protein
MTMTTTMTIGVASARRPPSALVPKLPRRRFPLLLLRNARESGRDFGGGLRAAIDRLARNCDFPATFVHESNAACGYTARFP